jgi:hypothetical protein
MDPLFVATPGDAEVAETLLMWPELSGSRLRPLLVSAFGDIFVEKVSGEVWVVSPIELSCERIARSVEELEGLFSDPEWAQLRLLTEVALAARDRGVNRPPDQVFAIAPHPRLTGSIPAGQLVPMSLRLWHNVALQIREQTSQPGSGDRS